MERLVILKTLKKRLNGRCGNSCPKLIADYVGWDCQDCVDSFKDIYKLEGVYYSEPDGNLSEYPIAICPCKHANSPNTSLTLDIVLTRLDELIKELE